MIRRMVGPLIFGLFGVAVLVGLGLWQLQRLDWKEAMLAEIEARIHGTPVPVDGVDAARGPEALRYLPVTARGRTTGAPLFVLTSVKLVGPGFRVISAFETEGGRRVMVDLGFLPDGAPRDLPPVALAITGNLHWPDEADGYTPAPDTARRLWYARDVAAMAAALDTEPLLIVVRQVDGPAGAAITPMPVTTEGIPNDHLQYAITWFSLAAVWAGMTAYLLWRIRRRTV